MKPTQLTTPLTRESIRELLENAARMLSEKTPSTQISPNYVRLMEIYCVVKAGGTATQIDAARRVKETEKADLLENIQTLQSQAGTESKIRALQQEIQELERAIAERLDHLSKIDPNEEAIVRQCLSEIDDHFTTLRTVD